MEPVVKVGPFTYGDGDTYKETTRVRFVLEGVESKTVEMSINDEGRIVVTCFHGRLGIQSNAANSISIGVLD